MGIDIVTFGCRLNINESEAMRAHAEAAGHDDLVIVNTCAVTAEATRQARQAIRRLRRERPRSLIVITGCAAQVDPARFAAMPEIDRVIGNTEKMQAPTWAELSRFVPDSGGKTFVGDIMAVKNAAAHPVEGFEGRARAFVQVQNGCDHRCTFCVIPFGRGPSRSVAVDAVVDQVRRLVDKGYLEVVITGVDITSYGADLPGTPGLGALVRQILDHVPDLPRLRLSSLDSIEVDCELIDALANEPRLMPHIHLSLQAGDDVVLKRMKRRHLRDDSIRFCATLRRLRPDIVFGADFIAGFPTETEAMFARSLDLVAECGLTHLHVFPFSPRPGTPAARMPPVPRDIVKERAKRLRTAGESAHRRFLAGEVGQSRRVLTEHGNVGRTEGFGLVRFAAPVAPGQLLDVIIAGHDGTALIAGPIGMASIGGIPALRRPAAGGEPSGHGIGQRRLDMDGLAPGIERHG